MTNKENIQRLNAKFINNVFLGRTNIEETKKKYLEFLSKEIDFNDIDLETTKLIGMQKWDDDSDIYLFPYYLYTIIPVGLKVISIFEEELVWTDHMDSDSRLGCLAFGLRIKDK